jgi:hypothetical protein
MLASISEHSMPGPEFSNDVLSELYKIRDEWRGPFTNLGDEDVAVVMAPKVLDMMPPCFDEVMDAVRSSLTRGLVDLLGSLVGVTTEHECAEWVKTTLGEVALPIPFCVLACGKTLACGIFAD